MRSLTSFIFTNIYVVLVGEFIPFTYLSGYIKVRKYLLSNYCSILIIKPLKPLGVQGDIWDQQYHIFKTNFEQNKE